MITWGYIDRFSWIPSATTNYTKGDGTYRFSPQSTSTRAHSADNATASIGGVRTSNWTGDFSQECAIVPQGNNIYRVDPRMAWWRVLALYAISNIGIGNHINSGLQYWILTTV